MRLFLILFLIPFGISAQMELRPNGMVDQSTGKGFLVIDSPGSQYELYSKSLTWVNGMYNSPLHSVNSVVDHSITVKGVSERAVKSRYKNLKYTYDLHYSITLEFKEGKVKYQIDNWHAGPLVNVGDFKPFRDQYGIYNEDLEVQNQSAKEAVESFFNGFLSLYKNEVLLGDDW